MNLNNFWELSDLSVFYALTNVQRQIKLQDDSRFENSAEHSWATALTALLVGKYFLKPFDMGEALKIILVHDLVEIECGDCSVFDQEGLKFKAEEERKAANTLFSNQPGLLKLWEEFDRMSTSEAVFANCMDRLQPFIVEFFSGRVLKDTRVVRDLMHLVYENMPGLSSVLDYMFEEFEDRQRQGYGINNPVYAYGDSAHLKNNSHTYTKRGNIYRSRGKSLLEEAGDIVYGDRNKNYGHPYDNHKKTAQGWTWWLKAKYDDSIELDAEDVCWMNIIQKMSRESYFPTDDGLRDTMGYAENIDIIRETLENEA